MIERRLYQVIKKALSRQATVVLVGPRQVGKTTLAHEFVKAQNALYLDLEARADRNKLIDDPALFLSHYEDHLVVLDEIHKLPELFQELRGLIDQGRRRGIRHSRFLILGSVVSGDLMKQSGESLAGRVEYIQLHPLNILEISKGQKSIHNLWVRGGFPDSFLADSDSDSLAFRQNFIRTYLERDIPQLGWHIPSTTLERFWTMLAHSQGTVRNASQLASCLAITQPTVTRYIDLLVDLMLVRQLPPFLQNTKKRLVKTPKIYVRDSGLLHALLHIKNHNELAGHPILGMSWEGFVIEQLLSELSSSTQASFYRTSAGAEIDLVLKFPNKELWAIEIKHSLSANPGKGFYSACQDIKPTCSFVVHAGKENYPIKPKVQAINLRSLAKLLATV